MRGFLQTQPNIMEDQRHNYLAEVRALLTREAGYGNPGRVRGIHSNHGICDW